jgi:peptidoglycan/LPS O-acetylase OafA/YrhL
MLFGLLLPLLRRVGARAQVLIGVVVMAAGLALVLVFALQGHAPGRSLLLVRLGILLAVAGPATLVSGVRRGRQIGGGDSAEQPGDKA